MSTDQAFDPSLLEGKDRNELVAIATSLGQKPPSRAKKADIVAIIMGLVGAGPAQLDLDGAEDAPVPAEDPAEERAGDAAESTEPGDAPAEAAANRDRGDGGRGRDGASAKNDQRGGQAQGGGIQRGQGNQQQGGGSGPRQGGGNQRNQQQGNQNQGGQNQGGQQQGNQQQGGQNQGGQNQGNHEPEPGNRADPQPQTEDGEGNRRRRRRGRDRNRGNEDEQVLAEPVEVVGIVDLRDEGYGFLRVGGYQPTPEDAYISVKQVRQFDLRRGDVVAGKSRAANRNERNPALIQLDSVNGTPVAELTGDRPTFDDLTPLFPDTLLRLEQSEFPENMTSRIIDLLAPIGKGQRGLIVSPPKAGKTTAMKQIIRAIERNHPEVHVIVLLLDERPEEVTDFQRWMLNGEVAASTFDRPAEEHVALAELVIDRAKRLVESGRDVAVIVDGITRLTRAYNLEAPANGRTLAGGLDSSALYPAKRFFGAARNVEQGGSLTILATALVDSGAELDEAIFEEFAGTGNMELRLDRRLADRRVFPAIDVEASSTRHEERLYDRKQLDQIHRLRRLLADLNAESGSGVAGLEMLVDRLKSKRTNAEFLDELPAT